MILQNFWLDQLFVFASYLAFTIVTSVAGSGGGLVLPFLVAFGYSPKGISATGKFAGWANGISSTINYYKAGYIDFKKFLPYLTLSAIGMFIGTFILINIDAELFKKMIGWISIITLPFIFLDKSGLSSRLVSNQSRILSYIFQLIGRSLISFIGVGTGFFLTYSHIRFAGFQLLESNALKRLAGSFISPLTIIPLAISGLVVYKYIPAIFLGGLLGGHIGSKIAIKKGNKFVKTMLVIVAVASAVRIILS